MQDSIVGEQRWAMTAQKRLPCTVQEPAQAGIMTWAAPVHVGHEGERVAAQHRSLHRLGL